MRPKTLAYLFPHHFFPIVKNILKNYFQKKNSFCDIICDEWRPGFRKSRKEEFVLQRLRTDNTYVFHTHTFYVKKIVLNA